MYQRFCSLFEKKDMFYSKQVSVRSKRSTMDVLAKITEQIKQGSTDTIT